MWGEARAGNGGRFRRAPRRSADPREPALLLILEPNVPPTLLVRGVNGATGLGLPEILELPQAAPFFP